MRNVITLILGGGKGTRLYPLTKERSKPAVPLAGKYRLIDIPISNCLNCGLNRMYVLTQYNSASLNRHVSHTYTFDHFGGGFVDILAAQQTEESADWYQGTADAVRQNLRAIFDHDADYVLILSGDQLYRMDYADLIRTHIQSKAEVTIGVLPVDREAARAFGIVQLDDSGRVRSFSEKPQTRAEQDKVKTDPAWIDARGIRSEGRDCLASMGIYVFNRSTLVESLTKTNYHDFGKEIFPQSIKTRHVQAHLFDGYWEDIGTIKAFYDANLKMASVSPPFELSYQGTLIYSRPRYLPPSRFDGATIRNSLIADGCTIESGAVIENSVIGLRSHIGRNVTIRDSVVMGADFFESTEGPPAGEPRLGIGEGSHIETTIVDKNCRIGKKVTVHNRHKIENSPETPQYMICDGIVVIPKSTKIVDGWTMPDA